MDVSPMIAILREEAVKSIQAERERKWQLEDAKFRELHGMSADDFVAKYFAENTGKTGL